MINMTSGFKIALATLVLLSTVTARGQEAVSPKTVGLTGDRPRDSVSEIEAVATVTTEDRNAVTPRPVEILVDTVDGNFEVPGYQVYAGSHLTDITYSGSVEAPDETSLTWSWSYTFDGGAETLALQGTGDVSPVTFDYKGKTAGLYEWILRVNDGTTDVERRQTTEVLSGTWSSSYAASILLDFDGSYHASALGVPNVTIPNFDQDGDTSTFSSSELDSMFQIFLAVSEKYSPFNIGVAAADRFDPTGFSDRDAEYAARNAFYEANGIVQILIGGAAFSPMGENGAALRSSFSNAGPNAGFVWPDGPLLLGTTSWIWEVAAHEAGHVFRLRHQSIGKNRRDPNFIQYNKGDREKGPIMGRVQDKRGLWWPIGGLGSTNGDMIEIAGAENGFGYRPDEAGDSASGAAAFSDVSGTSYASYGVISPTKDVDYYEFTTTQSGKVSFSTSVAPYGAMLDTKLQLRDANDNLLVESSNVTQLEESITDYSLEPGTYYLVVQGQELYGDVGQYWIDGTVPGGTTTREGPSVPSQTLAPLFSDKAGASPSEAASFLIWLHTVIAYGAISPANDVDYYAFTLTQSGQVSFITRENMILVGTSDTKLQLRDANDNLLVESSPRMLVDEAIIDYDLAPGTYYLVVQGQKGDLGQYWIDATVPDGTTSTAGSNLFKDSTVAEPAVVEPETREAAQKQQAIKKNVQNLRTGNQNTKPQTRMMFLDLGRESSEVIKTVGVLLLEDDNALTIAESVVNGLKGHLDEAVSNINNITSTLTGGEVPQRQAQLIKYWSDNADNTKKVVLAFEDNLIQYVIDYSQNDEAVANAKAVVQAAQPAEEGADVTKPAADK